MRSMLALSTSAPRRPPSSSTSASVSFVKPEMSTNTPEPCVTVGQVLAAGQAATPITRDVGLRVVPRKQLRHRVSLGWRRSRPS